MVSVLLIQRPARYKTSVCLTRLRSHLGLLLSEVKFNNKMKLSSGTKLVTTRQTYHSNQFSTPPVIDLRGTLGTPDTHWSDITLEPISLCSTSHWSGWAQYLLLRGSAGSEAILKENH